MRERYPGKISKNNSEADYSEWEKALHVFEQSSAFDEKEKLAKEIEELRTIEHELLELDNISVAKDIELTQSKEPKPAQVEGAEPNQTKELEPIRIEKPWPIRIEKPEPNQTKELGPIRIEELEPAQVEEPDLTQAKAVELAQAKELELQRAREKELAQAEELERQKNRKELYDTTQELLELESELESELELESESEKNINDYRDVTQELLELDEDERGIINEYHNVNQELLEIEEMTRENQPLVAINADWTHDKRELAHDLAEQALNDEIAKSNGIKKLWKGTIFKKYYEKKYTKDFLEGKRTNQEGKTLTEIIREESPAVIERFVLGAVEKESRYIHGKTGETLEKVDEETNEKIKHAIEKYARTSLKRGEKVSDLDRQFLNEMGRIMEDAIVDGRMEKGYKRTNYLSVAKEAARRYEEVAINARNKAEHDKAMAQVMAGFQAYNAEVRSNVRTEAHRDNIDKIVNWCESNAIGQFIPAEIIAGIAGAATALTQTGVRAVFGAVGGIAVSGVISGLKERNRVAEDRARMLRDVANGMEYDSENKKIRKHEQRIGGTLYDMAKAEDLTERINLAMNPENGKINRRALMSAIAEARVRIDFSDSEQKDLISYSSSNNRGKERLELDIALIRAEKALNEKDQEALEIMKDDIWDEIVDSVSKKDKNFKKYRTWAALKASGISLALGTVLFFGSQEAAAAIDPNKIGIFEKAGLLKTANNDTAEETLLASGFGQFRGSYEIPGKSHTEQINHVTDPKEIARLEKNGYAKVKISESWSEPHQTIAEVDPSASTARVDVKYDGWASNGTKIADGNEIRGHLVDGKFVSNLRGTSTFNGKTINYDPSTVKAYITVGDSKFEIASSVNGSGQLTWGENGVFTTTTGETIKAIGDNGEKLYKYFEIAADNGVDADGIHHIVPLATDVGKNTFSGKISEVIETTIDHPAVYSFVKEIPGEPETIIRGITNNGFAFAPELARNGLGEAIAPESEIYDDEVPMETLAEEPSLRDRLGAVPEENIEVMPEAEVELPPEAVELPPETVEEVSEMAGVSSGSSEAPETPDEAPEAASSTPEASSTTTEANASSPENFSEWENEIIDEIEDNIALIGEDGIDAITDARPLNSEMQANWRKWWSELSEEGKNFVRNLENRIDESEYRNSLNWGKAFRTWLVLNS